MRWFLALTLLTLATPTVWADSPPETEPVSAKRQKELTRLLRKAARKNPRANAALRACPDREVLGVLTRHTQVKSVAVRLTAITELGRRKAASAELELARVAVVDRKGAVRQAALQSLGQLASHRRAAGWLVGELSNEKTPLLRRLRAAEAIARFPAVRAVPAMIQLLRQTGSGGRGYLIRGKQRAYIKDVDVDNSGVIPVLNPSIGKVNTGVSLEVRVILVLRETLVRVLRDVTGQRYGAEPARWESWWSGAQERFKLPRAK